MKTAEAIFVVASVLLAAGVTTLATVALTYDLFWVIVPSGTCLVSSYVFAHLADTERKARFDKGDNQ